VDALVRQRARNDPHPAHGQSALQAAAASGHTECAMVLLEAAGAKGSAGKIVDSMCMDDCGNTSLHAACRLGDDSMLKLLLRFEANWQRTNNLGRNALHAIAGACERSTKVGIPGSWLPSEEAARGGIAKRRSLEMEASGFHIEGTDLARAMRARVSSEGIPPLSRRPARYCECLEAVWKHTIADVIADSGIASSVEGGDLKGVDQAEL